MTPENKIVNLGCVKLAQYRNINEMGQALASMIRDGNTLLTEEEKESFEIVVGIEKPMLSYFQKFNTKGLVKLAQLNGILSYVLFDTIGCEAPILVHPTKARAAFLTLNPKGSSGGKLLPVKQVVSDALTAAYPEPLDLLREEMASEGGLGIDKFHDITDALIVSLWARYDYDQTSIINDKELYKAVSKAVAS